MALIKCVECGNSISDKSEICVHCGCPTKISIKDNIDVDETILRKYLINGDRIKGIKYVKDTLHLELNDAKDYVKDFERNHPEIEYIHSSQQNIPRCPKCGSTAITTGQRGYSLITGFWGSNKTMNRCANCGHKWEPRR